VQHSLGDILGKDVDPEHCPLAGVLLEPVGFDPV
jgi:hypothetical protein